MTLGERIREEREKRGLTVEELAMKADISATTLSLNEEGKNSDVALFTASSIANVLDVTLDELAGHTPPPLLHEYEDELTFDELIAKARLDTGLTQKALAEKMGVAAWTVSCWEKGKAKPRLSLAIKLSDALGVPLSEFARCVLNE